MTQNIKNRLTALESKRGACDEFDATGGRLHLWRAEQRRLGVKAPPTARPRLEEIPEDAKGILAIWRRKLLRERVALQSNVETSQPSEKG